MRQLFGSRSAWLAILPAVLLAAAACLAAAEDDVALKLHNDAAQAIDVYIASEKSQVEKPWAHLQVDADEEGQCTLDLPDRYVVVVQAGQQRWRSKRIGLKEFLAAHPGYVLRISELGSKSIAAQVEPGSDAPIAAPDTNDSAPPAPPPTLPLKFRKYDLANQDIWSLTPHLHRLKLHNDMAEAVDVYIAPQNSQEADPWTHLKIEPRTDAIAELKAADPFIIRIELSNGSGRSRPIYLQEFLEEHPDYVMAVGRTYKGVVTGTPYSSGSAEGASSGSESSGSSSQPKLSLPPVSIGPAQQTPHDAAAERAPTLRVEWESAGR